MLTFFLDVFEYKRYGENNFKSICQKIIKEGNDVQLHIHPNRGYDENRVRVPEEYSQQEQIKIIDGR